MCSIGSQKRVLALSQCYILKYILLYIENKKKQNLGVRKEIFTSRTHEIVLGITVGSHNVSRTISGIIIFSSKVLA